MKQMEEEYGTRSSKAQHVIINATLNFYGYCFMRISSNPNLNYHSPPINNTIGHFGKYHNTLCLSPQILHKHCFQILLGLTMVSRENRNNAYAKFGGTKKGYYGIFRTVLFRVLSSQKWLLSFCDQLTL